MRLGEKLSGVGLLLIAIVFGVRYGAVPMVLEELVASNLDFWIEGSEGQENFVSFTHVHIL